MMRILPKTEKASHHFQRLSAVWERGQSQVGPMALLMSCKDTNLFNFVRRQLISEKGMPHKASRRWLCAVVRHREEWQDRTVEDLPEPRRGSSPSSLFFGLKVPKKGPCKSQSRVSMQRLLLCIRIGDHAGQVHQGSLTCFPVTDILRASLSVVSCTPRPPRERKGSRMGATSAQSGSRTSRTFRELSPTPPLSHSLSEAMTGVQSTPTHGSVGMETARLGLRPTKTRAP